MDYHVVAQGYGGLGYQLTRADKDKIDQILSEAREKSRETGKSVLINALIGKTGFRDGSISVWFRSKYFWVDRLKRPQQLCMLVDYIFLYCRNQHIVRAIYFNWENGSD